MEESVMTDKTAQAFSRLYDITRTLRSEHGCPWDKDQTPLALRRSLMEESFEAIDAITSEDVCHVREELGDVLFNLVLIATMYEESEDFTLAQSLDDICDKLIRRHPHVFAAKTMPTTDQVQNQWDAIKENLEGRKAESVLDTVPQGFPPLLRAYTLLKKAAKKGFTWQKSEDALKKVEEEFSEMQEAAVQVEAEKKSTESAPFTVSGGSAALNKAQLHLEEEVGDMLLALVNYARMLGVDPTVALDRANRKLYQRFTFVEKEMKRRGHPMDERALHEMTDLWNESKSVLPSSIFSPKGV